MPAARRTWRSSRASWGYTTRSLPISAAGIPRSQSSACVASESGRVHRSKNCQRERTISEFQRSEIAVKGDLKMTTARLVGGMNETTHTLLTPAEVWSGKIFSNGWKKPGLGTEDVVEKATGAKLGAIGIASPEDISTAAALAHEAQKKWAKMAGPKRGDVLREFS